MKFLYSLLMLLIVIHFVSADLGYSNPDLPKIKRVTPATITTGATGGTGNLSEYLLKNGSNADQDVNIVGFDLFADNLPFDVDGTGTNIYASSRTLINGLEIGSGTGVVIGTDKGTHGTFQPDGTGDVWLTYGTSTTHSLLRAKEFISAKEYDTVSTIYGRTNITYNLSTSLLFNEENIQSNVNFTAPNICYINGTNCIDIGVKHDQDLNTTSNVQFNTIGINTAPIYPMHIVMDSGDDTGLQIDGTANDWDGATGETGEAIWLGRDVNAGADKTAGNFNVYTANLYNKQTNTTLDGNKFYHTTIFRNQDDGKWYNNYTVSRSTTDRGITAYIDDNGYYQTTDTGRIFKTNEGSSVFLDIDGATAAEFDDTGGNNPSSLLYSYGYRVGMDVMPTLTSGTLIVRSYGLDIDLDGSSTGSSTNYGITLTRVEDADTNFGLYIGDNLGGDRYDYSIWDTSQRSWVLDKDGGSTEGGIKFGEGQDARIYYDGTNLMFQTNFTGSGDAYFTRNVSATGYITRTSVFDTDKGKALDYIKDSSNYIDGGNINHSKFYGYTTYEVTDFDNCWDVVDSYCYELEELIPMPYINESGDKDYFYEVVDKLHCEKTIPTITKDYWINYRKECSKKIEEGVVLDNEVDVLRQAVYELNEENKLIKQELCNKDNSYSFCLRVV